MKSIKTLKNISGKKVLLRVDFNVPIIDGKVIDDFRIKKAIPTIEYLSKKGAIVILITHLGRSGKDSLKPVFIRLKKYFPKASFVDESVLGYGATRALNNLEKGDIVLMKNLRNDEGEVKNSPSFARGLSRYADIYVNDAFSVCHRAHASIVGISKYLPSYAGLQLQKEIDNLSRAFDPKHPFLFILGGAKFETKMPLVKNFLRKADKVFIGGAIANDFFQAKNYEVGKSLVSKTNLSVASLLRKDNLILPIDVEVLKGKKHKYVKAEEVGVNDIIVDIGPETVKILKNIISKSKFILWNGPLGKYETGFGGATETIIKSIAKTSAYSLVGGGDIVSLISKLKMEDQFSFISTGGGATLEFLTKKTLVGIKALK